jgi:hypothetical protein
MKSKFTCALLLLVVTAISQPARLNIAVNDLSGKGIKQTEAEIISERLRSELLKPGCSK